MFLYLCRYAFVTYNSVEESIAAYKQAYELMWDARCIVVKFKRLRGSACIPGEPKPNVKKVKKKPNNATQVKTEENTNHINPKSNAKDLKEKENNVEQASQEDKINYGKSTTKQDTDKMDEQVEKRAEDDTNQTKSKSMSPVSSQKQTKNSPLSASPTSITSAKTAEEQQQQPWVINIKSYVIMLLI